MSPQVRRALRIDDPVAGDACHVAQLGSPDGSSGRLCDIALNEIHPNPSQPRKRFDDAFARGAGGLDPGARRTAADHRPAADGRRVRTDRGRTPLASVQDRRHRNDPDTHRAARRRAGNPSSSR